MDRSKHIADADLPAEGGILAVDVGGEPVVVARRGGRLFAVDGICPHAGAMLGDGELDGDAVVCPYHGWAFSLSTGACKQVASLQVCTHEVIDADGGVVVRLRLAGAPR